MSLCSDTWHGCYRDNYGLWCPESYAHPAKMAPGLCFRILAHLKERRLLADGDSVLDPMAGIGTTLLCAGLMGYPAVGVELEPKFVALAQANIDRLRPKMPGPLPLVLQSDARYLPELLERAGAGSNFVGVTSPPYSTMVNGTDTTDATRRRKAQRYASGEFVCQRPDIFSSERNIGARAMWESTYGVTPGQIGNLRDRPLKAITSPPYGDVVNAGKGGIDWVKAGRPDRLPENNPGLGVQGTREWRYGDTPGQIGRLKAIISPPYEGVNIHNENGIDPSKGNWTWGPNSQFAQSGGYGSSDGQLGDEVGQDYFSVMAQVYAAIAQIADVLAVVIKDPTRDGKLRTLGQDTVALLEATGWKLVCWHRALLFEEQETADLFGQNVKKPYGRLSFFKRLHYQWGSPVANFEHVLICVRKGALG